MGTCQAPEIMRKEGGGMGILFDCEGILMMLC